MSDRHGFNLIQKATVASVLLTTKFIKKRELLMKVSCFEYLFNSNPMPVYLFALYLQGYI